MSEDLNIRGTDPVSYRAMGRLRRGMVVENPGLANAIISGGQFGGDYSMAIANRMYTRTNAAAIDDALEKTTVEQHGDGVHLIRFPIVNAAAFETDEGLVLVDCGMAPAGPALVAACAEITDHSVHTVILTHFHCDHAFGAWALFDAGHEPQLVATAAFTDELQADIDSWGLNSRYTNQWPDDVPRAWDRAYTPTVTFHDRTTLTVGGVEFVLTHARGETADQLWVHVPSKNVVVSADYYQPFLPNAGNGKRRQRHLRDWATALTDMADCKPTTLLPMHGPAIDDPAEIQDRLRAHAAILDSIVDQVLAGLNAGTRRDLVVESVELPDAHSRRGDVAEQYCTVKDLANMAAGQYTGWWDDIPSHWDAAPARALAGEVARLAGGAETLVARALELKDIDIRLACQLADWAYEAVPESDEIREAAIEIYIARIEAGGTPTQEALVYLDHLAELKAGLST